MQGAIPHLRSFSPPTLLHVRLPSCNNLKFPSSTLSMPCQCPPTCISTCLHKIVSLWQWVPPPVCGVLTHFHSRFAPSSRAVRVRRCPQVRVLCASSDAVRVRRCRARPPVPCASAGHPGAVRICRCKARPPMQCASACAVRVRRCRARPPVRMLHGPGGGGPCLQPPVCCENTLKLLLTPLTSRTKVGQWSSTGPETICSSMQNMKINMQDMQKKYAWYARHMQNMQENMQNMQENMQNMQWNYAYSAYSTYFNMQNMQNIDLSVLVCILFCILCILLCILLHIIEHILHILHIAICTICKI